jgi:cytochrome b pre-mRNA-processing protein 3
MGGKSRIALLPPGFWRNSLARRIQPESIAARCPDEDRDPLMFGLFRASHNDMLSRLHGEMLAQSRRPSLFLDFRVPDTVEGRLDMLLLHLFLLVRSLSRGGETEKAAAQALCDHAFRELDRALREMGVGDLAVPKRMKAIAGLYAGCSASYASALQAQDETALATALLRNVYDGRAEAEADAAALARYVSRADDALGAAQGTILSGPVPFPPPSQPESDAA